MFSIDFGLEFFASLTGIRQLPSYFQKIPPFCRRAHLDFSSEENKVIPNGLKWSSMANKMWKTMITDWNSLAPVYYGWSVRSGENQGVVLLENFDQVILHSLFAILVNSG